MRKFEIHNRRYTGSKYKLMAWISEIVNKHCSDKNVLFDVFGGTGVVTDGLLNDFNNFIINDFLYSNNVIYKGFFGAKNYNYNKLVNIIESFNDLVAEELEDNYVSINFGNKYFSINDSKKIGYIREQLDLLLKNQKISEDEFYILLTSLLYSLDRISNTCGHYDAYIKKGTVKDCFEMGIIKIKDINKDIKIYKTDSNELASEVESTVAYIDPPYNSRQYSRFYHVLENIVKWEKPKLYGTALKPEPENMSSYCNNSAPKAFEDLITKLKTKYIIVSYNNTYTSKSSSSKNKITLEQIEEILNKKGKTIKYSKKYNAFNAGKTELNDHCEILFVTEVENND